MCRGLNPAKTQFDPPVCSYIWNDFLHPYNHWLECQVLSWVLDISGDPQGAPKMLMVPIQHDQCASGTHWGPGGMTEGVQSWGLGRSGHGGWIPKTVPNVRLAGWEVGQQEAGEPVHTQAQLLLGPSTRVHLPGLCCAQSCSTLCRPTVAPQAVLASWRKGNGSVPHPWGREGALCIKHTFLLQRSFRKT